MDKTELSKTEELADSVQRLAEEIETHADIILKGENLEWGKAKIHAWIDDMTGFVVNVAVGRVTIFHADGRHSDLTSPDLPFMLVRPPGPSAPRDD